MFSGGTCSLVASAVFQFVLFADKDMSLDSDIFSANEVHKRKYDADCDFVLSCLHK